MCQAVRFYSEHGLRLGVRLSDDCFRSVTVGAEGVVIGESCRSPQQIKSDTAPVVKSSRLGCSPPQENTDFHTLAFVHKLGGLTASDTRIKRD